MPQDREVRHIPRAWRHREAQYIPGMRPRNEAAYPETHAQSHNALMEADPANILIDVGERFAFRKWNDYARQLKY